MDELKKIKHPKFTKTALEEEKESKKYKKGGGGELDKRPSNKREHAHANTYTERR